ncbi:MAG: hypothetical protein ACPIA7_05320 [Akkermansiaceae bacterium]
MKLIHLVFIFKDDMAEEQEPADEYINQKYSPPGCIPFIFHPKKN